jgi:hypothetical protein
VDQVIRDKIEHAAELLLEVMETLKLDDAGVTITSTPAAPAAPVAAPAAPAADRKLCWGKKVSAEFKNSVFWIQDKISLDGNRLMSCIAFETGGTFSPSAHNPLSSATGLIQFMDATVVSMVEHYPVLASMAPNRRASDLAKLTAVQQLSWVFYYFRAFGDNLANWSLEDTYMAILLPSMIGKPLDSPMNWKDSAYRVNKGLDLDKNGTITKREATANIRRLYAMGMTEENYG